MKINSGDQPSNNSKHLEDEILRNNENPGQLETLYRKNKQEFVKALHSISEDQDSDLLRFWRIRLNMDSVIKSPGFLKQDLLVIFLLTLFSGTLLKLPVLFSWIPEEFFFTRNLAIIVFNAIIVYTFWQKGIRNTKSILIYGFILLILTPYLNLLPNRESDSIMLALIHAPMLMWCLFGLSYMAFDCRNLEKRIDFIRYNGEFITIAGLLMIAGGFFSALTIGLFSAIKMSIEAFYVDYVAVFGGVAIPMVSLYLIHVYPDLTNKIAPVIARVFTPLVLIAMTVYLVSLPFSESKILEDRDLLILFNGMLLAVLALIVFSISELDKSRDRNVNVLILFLLAALAIVINSIALIAIITRIAEGLTPNRTVVLVSNVLVFINLILIARNLFRSFFDKEKLYSVDETVAKYLNLYAAWIVVVIFILPFAFGFK
jgi:hypothetical protein